MYDITYKIYLPFSFGVGNNFYGINLTIKEFKIDDVSIKLTLDETGDEEKSFLIATTQVDEDGINDITEIADIKVGKAVQSFFDGLSKALGNAGFFNVSNGDIFLVKYEMFFRGWQSITPYNDSSKGFALDDVVVAKAIEYANSKNNFVKQAYFYLKEAEYFVDIGRFSGTLIQFAILTEHLINHVLSERKMIDPNGSFKKPYSEECNRRYKEISNERPSFAYKKYVYGLSKLGLKLEDEIVNAVDITHKLRNKLAHGHNLFEAIALCKILYGEEGITEYNIYDFMITISDYMTQVYNFFSEKSHEIHKEDQ